MPTPARLPPGLPPPPSPGQQGPYMADAAVAAGEVKMASLFVPEIQAILEFMAHPEAATVYAVLLLN